MNPHDVEVTQDEAGLWHALCNCGSEWVRERRQDALDAANGHFWIMKARAAIREVGE